MSSLLSELSRRSVFRVAAAYVVVAWIVLQVASILFVTFEAPGWVLKVFTTLIFLGFPIALIFSWAFELTPDGVRRSEAAGEKSRGTPASDLILGGLLVVVVAFYVISSLNTVRSESDTQPPALAGNKIETSEDGRVTIAVLPFTNMSSDDEQQYFSDGITEEILNALAHIDGLKVTSRTSSFSFKASPDDLPTVAAKLGVAHILEGSVRRSGDTLRITAQLIRAADDVHLWSQTFDRDLKDIFKVQEEISEAIAAALRVRLVKEEEGASEIDPKVYDLYLRALGNIARGSFADMSLAIERLERIIELEPDFARGHSGLARAISFSLMTGAKVGDAWIDRMEAAAHQALALDRQSREVYATLGNAAYFRRDLDWAIDNFAHAERLNALGMWDHFTYAGALVDTGQFDEVVRMAAETSVADPLNQSVYYGLAMAKAASGDPDGALSALMTAYEIEPENPISLYFAINILTGHQGRIAEAMELADRAYALDAADPEIQTQHALNHLSLGNYAEAERWIEEALANDPDVGFAIGVKGLILAAQGREEAARVLALRALDREAGAKNFRFGGSNMLVQLAYPAGRGIPWSDPARREYQRHWPELFQFEETGNVWGVTLSGVMSPPALAAPNFISDLRARGETVRAEELALWLRRHVGADQFWTLPHMPLFFAELAMVEEDEELALKLIEAEVADGFVLCWQWRLRDNPYFEPLRDNPRFKAALSGVARNIEMQKKKYTELNAGGIKS